MVTMLAMVLSFPENSTSYRKEEDNILSLYSAAFQHVVMWTHKKREQFENNKTAPVTLICGTKGTKKKHTQIGFSLAVLVLV